jgi:hypothetical protein
MRIQPARRHLIAVFLLLNALSRTFSVFSQADDLPLAKAKASDYASQAQQAFQEAILTHAPERFASADSNILMDQAIGQIGTCWHMDKSWKNPGEK